MRSDRYPTKLAYLAAACLVGGVGCSLGPNRSDWVNISVEVPSGTGGASAPAPFTGVMRDPAERAYISAPGTVDGFDCYAANVYGPGIRPAASGVIPDGKCSYAGVTSTLLSGSQTTGTIAVPSGSARTVQIIGVATGIGCDTTQTLAQAMASTSSSNYLLATLGSSTLDLFSSASVTIQNTYSGTVTAPFNCPGSTAALQAQPVPLKAGVWVTYAGVAPSSFAGANNTLGASTQLTGAQVNALPLGTATGITTALGGNYARVDLYFLLDGIPYSQYSSIELVMTGNHNIGTTTWSAYISGPGSALFSPTGFSTASTSSITFDNTVLYLGSPLTPAQAAYSGATINGAYASGGPSPALTGSNYIVVSFHTGATSGTFALTQAALILKP